MDIEVPKSNIPGFEFYLNNLTGHWALRPIAGYSEKNITDSTFIPKEDVEEIPLFESEDESNNDRKSNLNVAKKNKNDEFYTCLNDIASEMKHYRDFFKGKIVYCPCDKAFNHNRSQFVEYFISEFNNLGLKKLICTQYNPNGFGEAKIMGGIKWEYNGEYPDESFVDESKIDTFILKGNGSFRSDECRKFMQECDVVVTNPPFSLYIDFLSQIFEFGKKFIIIGNKNSVPLKDLFPKFRDNEMWLGFKPMSGSMWFYSPNDYHTDNSKQDYNGKWMTPMPACWYTNIDHKKRHEFLPLLKKYDPINNPKYANYDAIEVSNTEDIPSDYYGIMGVPITFMDKYNPEQFEIIECHEPCIDIESFRKLKNFKDHKSRQMTYNGQLCQKTYHRIFIRRK